MTALPKPLRHQRVPRPLKRTFYLGAKRAEAKATGTLTEQEWLRVCAWSRFRCSFCQKATPIAKLQQDHITPIAKGGTHSADNVALACPACNVAKFTATGWAFHPSLPSHPFRKAGR